MRYFIFLFTVCLTGCLYYSGTVDIDLRWEDQYNRFTSCRQAGVDMMYWRITDTYGDVIKESYGMVSCRDNITRNLRVDDDYNLEIEGYEYDYWDDAYYIEWEALCTGIRAEPYEHRQHTCEVQRYPVHLW